MTELVCTLRLIGGRLYRCYDIGCANFKRAKENREMVANKEKVEAYIRVEEALERTPLRCPLPSWIPLGEGYSKYSLAGGAQFIEEDKESMVQVVNRKEIDKNEPE